MQQTPAPGTSPLSWDWFPHTLAAALKGVALVMHGLNLKPLRMAAIVSALNVAGIDAYRLSLRGHGENFRKRESRDAVQSRLEDFKGVSRSIWFQESLTVYEQARQAAQRQEAPLFLIGFSYGGLIGLDLMASRKDVHFDRAVLFAPALSLRSWDHAVRLLSPFPRMVLPTLAPAGYTANPGTPIAGYNALFETLEHVESHLGPRLNIPALVVMDPRDELVSFEGLRRLVQEHRLSQWQFYPVPHQRSAGKGMLRHIVIDEDSVGTAVWAGIKKAMIAHLLGKSVSPEPA